MSICVLSVDVVFALFLSACSELEKPKTEPFYAETAPPPKKEFRWSNGKTPKSFDPALASAPPETDVVRAVFDGLTDTDSKNLQVVPAVAEKWEASGRFQNLDILSAKRREMVKRRNRHGGRFCPFVETSDRDGRQSSALQIFNQHRRDEKTGNGKQKSAERKSGN